MKIVSTKKMANGNNQITVNAAPDEELMCVRHAAHYKLGGGAAGQIVRAVDLMLAVQVYWDTHEQEWKDA